MPIDKNGILSDVFEEDKVPKLSEEDLGAFTNALAKEARKRNETPSTEITQEPKDELKPLSIAQNPTYEVTPKSHGVGTPGLLAIRRGYSNIDNESVGLTIPEQEPKPATTKQAGDKIDDFVTFEPDGRAEGEVQSTADLQNFDKPVEGFVGDKTTGQDKPESLTTEIRPDSDRNAQIAQAAMGKEPVISSGPAAQSEELPNDGGGLSEFDKIKANNGSDAVPAALQSQTPNLAEQPVVTIDDIEKSQDQELKPKIAQPTISAKPKELIDPDEVPITVTKTQEDLSAIAPAGETRVPERGNGVDDKVAEIQSRIREGDGRFNNEVKAEIAENQEGTIAPAPEKPGTQTVEQKSPEVHIDGRPGIIGGIKPNNEDGKEDMKDAAANHQQMAVGVTGDEDSSFFARLAGKFKNQNHSAENLKKAA